MGFIRAMGRFALIGAVASGVALTGCAGNGGGEDQGATVENVTVDSDTVDVDEGVMEDSVDTEANADAQSQWQEDGSATEAGQGAGLDGFSVPASVTVGGVSIGNARFSHMPDIAEATYEVDGTKVVIRKGRPNEFSMSVSGDYNGYDMAWGLDCNGRFVNCSGKTRGEVILADWKDEGTGISYSVASYGTDGDAPMTEDELRAIVMGIA